jgi:glutamate/tyrosine decarboxylase-like PLP-dependent enzyme
MDRDKKEFLQEMWEHVLTRYFKARESVYDYEPPGALKKIIDFSLSSTGIDGGQDALKAILESVIAHSPRAEHGAFVNYLYSTPDPVGLLGDWLISLINSNVHAYEASPVFAVAETELIGRLALLIGYNDDADGLFCPGGSYSNMLAMYLARNRIEQNRGLSTDSLVVFVSEQGHFSIAKSAAMLGIRKENVIMIRCDDQGRMVVQNLRTKIENALETGKIPFFVCATCGTTVLGGFDPIVEIQRMISKHPEIWLHLDAAWGGAVLCSKEHRWLMDGVEMADSLTWDFHKALHAPIFCSVLMIKAKSHFSTMFEVDDSYLFHDEEDVQHHNLGRKSPQCGRRGDAFKMWLMWKVHGGNFFAYQVNSVFQLRREVIARIAARTCFRLYDERPDFWNICFWYLPDDLRSVKNPQELAGESALDALTEKIYAGLKRDGQALVNYARVGGYPAFIRLVLSNPNFNLDGLDRLLDIIESLGNLLSLPVEELIASGGDERLERDENGLNYTLTKPTPFSHRATRSSCTGAQITSEEFARAEALVRVIRAGRRSFRHSMGRVHARLRQILDVDKEISIITTPSGTDCEYIPLLITRMIAGAEARLVNIMTGAGEIGSGSVTAASGRFFKATTPAGDSVEQHQPIAGFNDIDVIEVAQRDEQTGKPSSRAEIWIRHVQESLSKPNTFALLHLLESSKLGYRLDELDKISELLRVHRERLLVVIDACQSRTDIGRIRTYLKLGCMVMITGSKFEEGPPFSGAVIIPTIVTQGLTTRDFRNFPPDLRKFITRYDVSGPLNYIRDFLPYWMNWGVMLRWTLAMDNWEAFRRLGEETRTQLVRGWVEKELALIASYRELEVLGGGEHQSGSVGDINTIISVKLIGPEGYLSMDQARRIYLWMAEDMTARVASASKLSAARQEALGCTFLLGQPVAVGPFALLRIALGARLVLEMNKMGMENVLRADKCLLDKLSVLVAHVDRIEE